jgi:X-X-X-Leu-X-X-Gly heptad repeat protein
LFTLREVVVALREVVVALREVVVPLRGGVLVLRDGLVALRAGTGALPDGTGALRGPLFPFSDDVVAAHPPMTGVRPSAVSVAGRRSSTRPKPTYSEMRFSAAASYRYPLNTTATQNKLVPAGGDVPLHGLNGT